MLLDVGEARGEHSATLGLAPATKPGSVPLVTATASSNNAAVSNQAMRHTRDAERSEIGTSFRADRGSRCQFGESTEGEGESQQRGDDADTACGGGGGNGGAP